MSVAILMTHMVAHREKKPPFFFSRYNFQSMRERGNTHYCFHCLGKWGFTPDKDGNPTNHLDDKIWIRIGEDEYILIADALKDPDLEKHIADTAGYPRHKPGDSEYEAWLGMSADFMYSPELEIWCESKGYGIFRFNPMEGHDPVTHASGVVGDADKFQSVYAWLEAKVGPDFPCIVTIT